MKPNFSSTTSSRKVILLLSLGLLFTLLNVGLYLVASEKKNSTNATMSPTKPAEKSRASVLRTIDLTSYCNESTVLSTNFAQRVRLFENMSALPLGTNIFGGIPFWVSGIIHLGNPQTTAAGFLPEQVSGILVGGKFKKIHILHGLQSTTDMNKPVAFFRANYRTGKSMQIPIIYSKHVRHYMVPDKPANYPPMDNSEIAWRVKAPPVFQPPMILRLYRTTFDNPFPEEDMESLDYVSTLTYAESFLCGLSVE